MGAPRFKSKRKARLACRFTTGVIRVDADGRHVTLPRLRTIRTHEPTVKDAPAPDPAATDGCRRLIAGQQQGGPFVRQAEGPLQSWADLRELLSEPVDLAGAVVDEVGAAADHSLEVDGYLVAWPEHADVIAPAGLVGDDEGVLGVSFALAAVSS
jgi:hypothetical protein